MRASENGYDDIVRTLLQADADINAQNNVMMMMMMIVIDVFMLKIVNYDDSKLKLIILIMMI